MTFEQKQAQDEALEKMRNQKELVMEQRRADKEREHRGGVQGDWRDDGVAACPDAGLLRVVITGVRLPFWDVLSLAVQFSVAAIPAAFVAVVVWGLVGRAFFGG